MKPSKVEFELGDHKVTLETGRIARQATAAVMAHMDDNSVLCTVVAAPEPREGVSFFPLTVDYQERTYAAGKIPGGFFRREGRPTEKETLTSRLIDRPIRPLFHRGFQNEVHVIATVMSVDRDVDPDVVAMIGTSAALTLSGVPFSGPIGANRVGFIDNLYVLNPRISAQASSRLNMIVAGTENAVLMVESEAHELSEDQMLGAVLFAHQEMQIQIQAINQLVDAVGNEKWVYSPPVEDQELVDAVTKQIGDGLHEAYQITTKAERKDQLKSLEQSTVESLTEADETIDPSDVSSIIQTMGKKLVRQRVLDGQPRIDGRRHDEVRDLEIDVGILKRTHGSALFQRGETQAIVTVTLGTTRDAALIESLSGESTDQFMLHYNFPPYCVGETGRLMGPRRREVGHGRLARRSLEYLIPDSDKFPYTIRVVSEITESNGSSSMASVCGASLALMDAGVQIPSSVAGIAMGLIKEDDKFVVLTDILGDEDHLGDMDFKVAGTANGVTALQMDIKIEGITEEILSQALAQAHDARKHILAQMDAAIEKPRAALSEYAPAVFSIRIDPEMIRVVIGKGGATIRGLRDEFNAEFDVEDDGEIRIYSENRTKEAAIRQRILDLTETPVVGKIYSGEVASIMKFGAFITILPKQDGLLHISRIKRGHVAKVNDELSVGQIVEVVITEIDDRGRVQLSMIDVERYRDKPPNV